MPCWYYEKKDLVVTPSIKDGISPETEARYRRDGARFIMDAGTKMGLRFDTCATGVVYFHRFYMFHSFKEFHRFLTAACCLFLAGKVEETPKKCKDLIKITRSMLTDAQFSVFKDDPKEEVMTLERILLQTIKFDLMVEHPYAYLLKYAKLIKGDKAKVQKMVQMAWTFINDSLCTTLCLQWEPEIIAVALMYLTSRLNKFEITDWQGKPLGYRGRWYEFLVEDVTLELLEDICHQVLDLYSKPAQKGTESPAVAQPHPQSNAEDQSHLTPKTPISPHSVKRKPIGAVPASQPMDTDPPPQLESPSVAGPSSRNPVPGMAPSSIGTVVTTPQGVQQQHQAQQQQPGTTVYSQTNPYVSSQMYSSSFMSQEGSQSIQSLIGVEGHADSGHSRAGTVAYQQGHASTSGSQYSSGSAYTQPAPTAGGYQQQHPSGYQPSAVYQPQAAISSYSQQYSYTAQYDAGSYSQPPQQQQQAGYGQSYLVQANSSQSQPYVKVTSPTAASASYQTYGTPAAAVPSYATSQVVGAVSSRTPAPPRQAYQSQQKPSGSQPPVRITGRHSVWH